MDNTTQQQIAAKFPTLPMQIQELLSSAETFPKIERVAAKFNLSVVETGMLAQVTSHLLMGFIKPAQFIAAIIEELRIPTKDAVSIATELNRELFSAVKGALEEVHGLKKAAPVVATTPATSSTPVVQNVTLAPQIAKPTGSVLEQKLSGTFKVSAGGAGAATQTITMTPPAVAKPLAVTPAATQPASTPAQTAPSSSLGGQTTPPAIARDMYREVPKV